MIEDAPRDSNRKAGVRRDIRAAAIGGLAATLVVAASLAPKLLSHPTEVDVHNSSTESALVESTTTTAAPDTTTTEAPTTTTTAAIEQRVTVVENKVARIEATTTTTAPPKDACGRVYDPDHNYGATFTEATWTPTFDGATATFTLAPAEPDKTSWVYAIEATIHYTVDGHEMQQTESLGERVCNGPVVKTFTMFGTITAIEITSERKF